MRYLRYLALLGIFMLTASYSQAQVSVRVGVGAWYRGYYGRRSISVGTAIERAPFLPTARTAKKWLSVETPFKTVSPGEAANSYTVQRGTVVSLQRISKPPRSGSSSALQETFASGVTAPVSFAFAGGAGACANCRSASALSRATSPINAKLRYFSKSPYSIPFSVRGV